MKALGVKCDPAHRSVKTALQNLRNYRTLLDVYGIIRCISWPFWALFFIGLSFSSFFSSHSRRFGEVGAFSNQEPQNVWVNVRRSTRCVW